MVSGFPPAEPTIDWQVLCPLDADGDGYANGVEVDDPDCMYPDVVPNSTSSLLAHSSGFWEFCWRVVYVDNV